MWVNLTKSRGVGGNKLLTNQEIKTDEGERVALYNILTYPVVNSKRKLH